MRASSNASTSADLAPLVERLRRAVLVAWLEAPRTYAWACIVGGLGVSWLIGYAIGGAGVAAPHWFYLPILFGAARFGARGAGLSALGAGALAGPLLPLDVGLAIAQTPLDWITRAAFFLIVGQACAVAIGLGRATTRAELQHQRVTGELAAAIQRRELTVHYQPIVSLGTGEIVGAEALVRWQHPQRGVVLPDEFIDDAERSGLIVELGDLVLDSVAAQLLLWQAGPLRGRSAFKLAVNVSPRQLASRRLFDQVERIRQLGVPLPWLHLEITENALIDDSASAAELLDELKSLGVGLAIDDFGSGRATLSYLHDYPFDVVKIDRSFVASLGLGGRPDEVSRAVIELAHRLDMRTVAEGVESPDQVQVLRRIGCDLAQGYLFGRPAPPRDLLPLLRRAAPFAPLLEGLEAQVRFRRASGDDGHPEREATRAQT